MGSRKILDIDDFIEAVQFSRKDADDEWVRKNAGRLYKEFKKYTNPGLCPHEDMRKIIDDEDGHGGDLWGCDMSCSDCWECCFQYWIKNNMNFWKV